MRDNRYLLVVMNPRGQQLKRMGVSRGSIKIAAGVASLFVLLGITLLIHGLVRHTVAEEARQLAEENRELRALQHSIQNRLPAARLTATRAELTFAQLWQKSGLGPEPKALGVGPLEESPAADGNLFDSGNYHRQFELLDIPLELDRMSKDGPRLQNELGELLEYFHDARRLLSNTPSIKPARTRWNTSGFGRRKDPITGQTLMHKGIDLAGSVGDPIYAPADGVVIYTGRRGGYGNTVVIDHGYGLQTHFAHLSEFRVTPGQRVERGHLIAEMGNTGKSTGPHLHYEVRRMGQPVDPKSFIMD